MTVTLSQLQAAEKNGTVASLVKQSIADAARLSTSVKFVAAKNYKAGSKTLSVFLCVANQHDFLEHMKKNGGPQVRVAAGNARVTKDDKNHHKIVVESLAAGSTISHNDVSTLIKPATGNADGYEGTTPAREQAEQEHRQAEASVRPQPDPRTLRRESLQKAQVSFSRDEFEDVFYPASGPLKVAAAGQVAGAFRAAVVQRLQSAPYNLTADDVQVIGLENLAAAQTLVDRALEQADHDQLEVVGGLLKNGDLALAVLGPGSSAPAAPVVLRADFKKKVIGRLANPKNAVANIQPGDATIDKAAEAQAKKFGVTAQKSRDDINVGGIKVGTVVLAAHGKPAQVGADHVIGTHLGQKTPAQIVALLTENADESKRLSPKFHGVILLSGCFTAAGKDGVVPPNYDYDTFARQVYQLLLKKDYTDFEVHGMPGPSKTDEQGNKTAQPVEAFLKQTKVEKDQEKAQTRVEQAQDFLNKVRETEKALLNERQALRAQSNATTDATAKAALEAEIDDTTQRLEKVRAMKSRLNTMVPERQEEERKLREEWDELEKQFKPGVERYGQRKV